MDVFINDNMYTIDSGTDEVIGLWIARSDQAVAVEFS